MVDFTLINSKLSKKTTKLTLKWGIVDNASAAERKIVARNDECSNQKGSSFASF